MVDWAADQLHAAADKLGQLAVVADVSKEANVDGYVPGGGAAPTAGSTCSTTTPASRARWRR